MAKNVNPPLPIGARGSYLDTDLLREHQRVWAHYFRLSLFWHVGLIALFLAWTFIFPSQPLVLQPSIQVDIVGLPDFTKNQRNTVDTSLPVKEEVKPAPVEVPPPTPDLMTLAEEKKSADAKPKETKPVRSKPEESAQSALDRLRKELNKKDAKERQRLIEEKKQELAKFDERFRARLAGNSVSQGSNISGVPGEVVNAYLGHITDKIRAQWELPPFLQSQNLRASARMYIEANGSVRYAITRSSGNEIFDNLVKDALERAKPFAPPPAALAGELKRNGVEVLFPL